MTAFTMTSPTSGGALPEEVSAVGGIVIDVIGANQTRVVIQIAASELPEGFFELNPGVIVDELQDPSILGLLGGGISELAIRFTIYDGDSQLGNFDYLDNQLQVAGNDFGDFSDVTTEQTDPLGENSFGFDQGFGNDTLDTGWFYSDDQALLQAIFEAAGVEGISLLALMDDDPGDNYYDFTLGIDSSLVDVGHVVVTPAGQTLIGTFRDEGIIGGEGDDMLAGKSGSDELIGAAGDDTLSGGGDQDLLDGGEGNDLLLGGKGDDFLFGGEHDDVLKGGAGHDLLDGSLGNDTLIGGTGSDEIALGAGDDRIVLGTGLQGDGDADFVFVDFAFTGNDVVLGFEAGLDIIDLGDTGATVSFANSGHAFVELDTGGTILLKGLSEADYLAVGGDIFL